ncbi:MAG: CvpA family protein, partial [Rhizobiales bacterium]|nr:CvpA family protein [Hyphomicrobiales bacterium]
DWVRAAKSKFALESAGEWLKSILPDDPENTILRRLKKKGDEEQTDASPELRTTGSIGGNEGGYPKASRDGLKQLIESRAAGR